MQNLTDIIFVSKRWNFARSIRIPPSVFFATCTIFVCIIISTAVLSIFNATEFFAGMNVRKAEQEHDMLVAKLDSLNRLLNLAHNDLDNHIAQDNRERTFWQMACIHPDIWSMGVGGAEAEPVNKVISERINRDLNQLYESIDILKGKYYLRKTSIDDIGKQIEDNYYLWSHIPSTHPVPGRRVGSGFGYRVDPIDKKTIRMHWGVDIGAPRGTNILATADGVVSYTGRNKGYGIYVDIDHGFGFRSRYAHCSSILVENGDIVKRGQIIALIGNTGRTTCPHLHYEVHVSGIKVNPKSYIDVSDVVVD